jgi:hypothetical protein
VRLSALLGCTVRDRDGVRVGVVHDVRLVADGPPYRSGLPSYRLAALVCGPVAAFQRLGYGREDLTGPALLDWLFTLLARHSRLVEWDLVESVTDSVLHLRVAREELPLLRGRTTRAARRAGRAARTRRNGGDGRDGGDGGRR